MSFIEQAVIAMLVFVGVTCTLMTTNDKAIDGGIAGGLCVIAGLCVALVTVLIA